MTFPSILMAVCIATFGAGSPNAFAASDTERTLILGGQPRSFLVHVPSSAGNDAMPLIIILHGGGGTARYMQRRSGFDALADQHGFVAVYPQGVNRHWNDGRSTIKNKIDDVEFIATVIRQVERHYPIDSHRIYATGISNGALFSQRLACEMSHTIAAIAPVAGTLPVDIHTTCKPARPVSVLQIDGTDDPIMPYDGGEVYNFRGRGEGGAVMSVVDTVRFWSRINDCKKSDSIRELAVRVPTDSTRIKQTIHHDCRGGSEVILDSVQGGGHTWPGGTQYLPEIIVGKTSHQIDASTTIVEFFLSHPQE